MNDYISREALIRKLGSIPALCKHPNLQALCEEWAKSIPAADVVEVVHGEWIEQANPGQFDFRDTWVRCSNCNYLTTAVWSHSHQFCPNCGAKMDGGADNG